MAQGLLGIDDTTLNITWLEDWNYAKTSASAAANAGGSGSNAIHAEGTMGWDVANSWANNLVYGRFDDCRLPTIVDTGMAACAALPSLRLHPPLARKDH